MELDAWITLAVLIVMLIVLALDRIPPAATVLTATILLLFFGILTEEEAFAGFSNPAPLTVAALYVLARGAEKTGLLGPFVGGVLGKAKDINRLSLTRLLLPTAAVSGFVNNTPLVSMLIGEINSWCAQRNLSPSRLLMPLSFAAILGGTITVIGTSTNLVASGLLQERGQDPIGLFEITPIGGAVALVGLIALLTVVPVLLPLRRDVGKEFTDETRDFAIQMKVEDGGSLDGKSVSEAGLRHLEGVYLIEIERGGELITAVSPSRTLRGGDRLTFVGEIERVVDLQKTRGLVSAEADHLLEVDRPGHTFYEAVVGTDSRLAGKTLAELNFRARYQAAVVAIHRAGERVRSKLGQEKIEPGDTLVLLAGTDFRTKSRQNRDFLLVAPLGGDAPTATRKAPIVGGLALAVIGLSAFDVVPIFQAALGAAGLLVVLRVLSLGEARDAIDLNVIVLIAAAFGVGTAMEATGLAEEIANLATSALGGIGDLGLIIALVLATVFVTEIITNNAAVVVVLPIGLSIAAAAGMDGRIIAMSIAVAASASFMTPMGYQTNTMVWGPGGYRFFDYIRAGFPVTIAVVIANVAMTYTLA